MIPQRPLIPRDRRTIKGMTLAEVMISATIFSFAATALVGLFLANQRFSAYLGYRSQAITASMSVLEQLRFRQYSELDDIYNDGASGTISIEIVDPLDSSGYQTVVIPINVRDGVKISTVWKSAEITVDPDTSAPKLPMQFFFMLTKVKPAAGTRVDLFEVVLLYQWRGQGKAVNSWQTSNVRLVIPNLNPIT
ncbi:prepilin-type N-terminal cleavage/methylation domain-containing protein [bacterium]|nr:prepilin-type N-terminal cleavage/methylation domain-containing protein [bacterium]